MRAVKPYIISKEYKDKQKKRIKIILSVGMLVVIAAIVNSKIKNNTSRVTPFSQVSPIHQNNLMVQSTPNAVNSVKLNTAVHQKKETFIRPHAAISLTNHHDTQQKMYTVIIQSSPIGALVKIDRDTEGPTPLTIALKSGSHGITIEKQGYKTIWDILNIKKNGKKTFAYTLDTE